MVLAGCSQPPPTAPTDATAPPADASADAPADASADAPADASADAPADASADASADAPVDAPADASADAPADASADASVDAPADASADAPADADAPTQSAWTRASATTNGQGLGECTTASLAANTTSTVTFLCQNNGIASVYVRTIPLAGRYATPDGLASANGACTEPVIDAAGAHVAFASRASNLVTGDANGRGDIFVYTVSPAGLERASIGLLGAEANGDSEEPSISGDGRYVAFASSASNLATGDTNGQMDIFVYDRQTKVTERVSVSSANVEANGASSDGAISPDGRYVAFQSSASNLVAGDTNGRTDVFLFDRTTRTIERIAEDAQFPSVSTDAKIVVFQSNAALVAGDTNGTMDVYVRDRVQGTTSRVSVGTTGNGSNERSLDSMLSYDGRFVVFHTKGALDSLDTNGLEDIYLRDLGNRTTLLVSSTPNGQSNGPSRNGSISGDGKVITFETTATNFFAGDTSASDVVVRTLP